MTSVFLLIFRISLGAGVAFGLAGRKARLGFVAATATITTCIVSAVAIAQSMKLDFSLCLYGSMLLLT